MNANEIYSVIKSGSPEPIHKLIKSAPASGFKSSALALSKSRNPSSLVLGLSNMIMEYCEGRDPEYGANLAEATYRFAFEIFEEQADHGGLLPTTLSNLASQHLNALNYLGRSEEVIAAAEHYLPIYFELDKMENYPSLVLAKANALFNLNRIDESRALLENLNCNKSPGSLVGKDRLLNRIYELIGNVTELDAQENSVPLRQSMFNALSKTDPSVFADDQGAFEQLKKILADAGGHWSLDPNHSHQYEQMLGILDAGESLLTRGASSDSEIDMRKKSRDATSIFHPAALRPPGEAEVNASLGELAKVYQWATVNQNKALLHDAIWGIYLCHARLDQSSKAADALIELRTHLEAQRAGITDPVKRGGAFSTYPQLFNVMCERLSKSRRYFELLEAIEASKGRAIADFLTRKQNRPVPDADVYAAVSKLPSLTQTHRFNYLSFHLDRFGGEATIYPVMLCRNGETYSIEPIKLDRVLLDNALENLDPNSWDQPGFHGSRIPDASAVLAPLTRLIGDLHDRGVIGEGDHICYTADERLNNIPLHYLRYGDGLLIDFFSFSRIHNAAQLEFMLEDAPPAPDYAEVFVVPTTQDTESEIWPEFEQSLNRPASVLAEYLDVQIVKNERASIESLRRDKLTQAIVHFSTHGISEIGSLNPFTGSGLVVSDGTNLPDKNRIAHGDLNLVLTPKKLVDSDLDMHNSHVSLMACVSGLSREGLGGDALGLDWALVHAGARSILSSHWMISARLAADFFDYFYRFWLGEKQSKAQAYRNTVKALQESSDPASRHQCFAFSLSGDWR